MNTLVTISNLDATDRKAAKHHVDTENARRVATADSESETPPTLLPTSTAAEFKDSYESLLAALLTDTHTSHVVYAEEAEYQEVNVRVLWKNATSEQRAAARAALTSP